MSARKASLAFTPQARQDISDVLLHTRQMWGRDQRDIYKNKIDSRLDYLRRYPEGGPPRVDLYPTCRMLEVERHIIYYRLRENSVRIVRVLPERVDPRAHLDQVQNEFVDH